MLEQSQILLNVPELGPDVVQVLRHAARVAGDQSLRLSHLFAALEAPDLVPLPPAAMRFSAAVSGLLERARQRAEATGAKIVGRDCLVAVLDAELAAQGFIPNRLRFARFVAGRERAVAR